MTIEEAPDLARKAADDYLKAKARIEARIAEVKEDDEKRKLYFGYFETSDGDL